MKKNEIIEVFIEDIGINGEGIGHYEGCTFFVKNAVFGDRVKAVITRMKKEYGYAKMLELAAPSPYRIEAPCIHARRCGGCQIMELSYDEQLRFKERKVRMNLERIGGLKDLPILPILGMETDQVPLRYRNKMQFPFGRDRDGRICAGFYAGRTHSIIDTEDCPSAPEACSRILSAVKEFIRDENISVYNEVTGQGLIRHLLLRTGFRTGDILVCLVLNGESLQEDPYTQNVDIEGIFVDKILGIPLNNSENSEDSVNFHISGICLNRNTERTNVILGKEIRCLYGKDHIFDEITDHSSGRTFRFKISPRSFYQVNPVQTEKLYGTALEFADLTGRETVWDLYCGTGTISLFLAEKARYVRGVEIVEDAVRDARENAERNGIRNAEFFCGRAEEIFPSYARREESVVVLDPPRKGCDRALLDAILQTGPERIVYISCDSATLARDLKILTENRVGTEEESGQEKGRSKENAAYRIEKIRPVDMFPNTVHVECVALLQLSNRKPDSFVKLNVKMEDYYRIKDCAGLGDWCKDSGT